MPLHVSITRREDWVSCMTEFINDSRRIGITLDWDTFHCGSWAAQFIQEISEEGVNILENLDNQLTTPLAWYKYLQQNFNGSIREMVASYLPEIPLSMTGRGDIILAPAILGVQDAEAALDLGIAIADPPIFWGIAPDGVGSQPIEKAVAAFRVGNN